VNKVVLFTIAFWLPSAAAVGYLKAIAGYTGDVVIPLATAFVLSIIVAVVIYRSLGSGMTQVSKVLSEINDGNVFFAFDRLRLKGAAVTLFDSLKTIFGKVLQMVGGMQRASEEINFWLRTLPQAPNRQIRQPSRYVHP
jgi:methyl-accepting chemotaxis protein